MQMSPNARQVMLLSVLYFTLIFLLLAPGGCVLRKVEAGDFRVWTAEEKRCANNPRGGGGIETQQSLAFPKPPFASLEASVRWGKSFPEDSRGSPLPRTRAGKSCAPT